MAKFNFAENYPVWAQDATPEQLVKSAEVKNSYIRRLMLNCNFQAAVFQNSLTQVTELVREDRLYLYKLHLSLINNK